MCLQVEMQQNGTNNILKDKLTTKKVLLMFSDVCTGRKSTSKVQCMYLAVKSLKISSK